MPNTAVIASVSGLVIRRAPTTTASSDFPASPPPSSHTAEGEHKTGQARTNNRTRYCLSYWHDEERLGPVARTVPYRMEEDLIGGSEGRDDAEAPVPKPVTVISDVPDGGGPSEGVAYHAIHDDLEKLQGLPRRLRCVDVDRDNEA